MKKYKCRFCNQEFEFEKQQQFASHSANCLDNPSLKNKGLKIKENNAKKNPIQNYKFNCKACSKEYSLELKLTEFNKGNYKKYCSRKCANSHMRTEESKLKTSNTMKDYHLKNLKIKIQKKSVCVVCGNEFNYVWNRKTCSSTCGYYLISIKRQKLIEIKGTNNWKTKQELFNYKFIENIQTDSKLEQAAIIYLVDVFKADKIEKYRNILNFWEGDSHRTFNPDFYVKKEGKVYIVEVKMKWIATTTHSYNRTIPYKKEALSKYCKEKGYEMIWLDFDYDFEFQKIYFKHLSVCSQVAEDSRLLIYRGEIPILGSNPSGRAKYF